MTRIDNKTINLHAYFDAIALDQDPDNRISRPLNDTMRASIEKESRDIMAEYPPESLADLIAINDSHAWGVEAFEMAVEHIYSYTKHTKQITQEYQDKMRPLLYKQIALGGYRLANAIADVYA